MANPPCENSTSSNTRMAPWTSNASTTSATCWPTSRRVPTRFGGIFDYDRKALRLNEVNAALENPNVWNEPKRAQELGREKRLLDDVVSTIDQLTTGLADNTELYELSKDEGDDASLLSIDADAARLESRIAELEFRRMF